MPDWQTRLQLDYHDPVSGSDVTITPIDAFTPTFGSAADVLHSIEQTHIGYVFQPQAITFTMTVKAIGPVVGELTALAMSRTPFKVTLHETNDGHDWSFTRLVLDNCVITSAGPSPVTVSGAPAATFSGVSLSATADPKVGSEVKIP
jgi:hypothetical protein